MRKYNFTIHGNKYNVNIKKIEGSTAEIEVNGSIYKVDIDKQMIPKKTPQLVRQRVETREEEASIPKSKAGGSSVKSPLPGTVFKLIAKEGDKVKEGDKLIVLEAMKMENDVLSDTEGTVESIKVREGDNVLEGDVLLTIS